MAVVDIDQVVAEERSHLFGVAYRMLGSVADAEDAVQEAFIKWHQADQEKIERRRGWLTTAITRYCLDQLKSARARREAYVGQWLPEPLVDTDMHTMHPDPGEKVALDESLSLAMLVVLETLSPAERAVFVLHDVFGYEFDEVATMVDRSSAACRQLASRARKHVEDRRPRFEADAEEQRRVVEAFLDAGTRGDVQGLLALLDPSVVMRGDGAGRIPTAPYPLHGAERVAKVLTGGRRLFPNVGGRLVRVNGGTGVLLMVHGDVIAVTAFTVANGRITAIDIVANPEKLRTLQ